MLCWFLHVTNLDDASLDGFSFGPPDAEFAAAMRQRHHVTLHSGSERAHVRNHIGGGKPGEGQTARKRRKSGKRIVHAIPGFIHSRHDGDLGNSNRVGKSGLSPLRFMESFDDSRIAHR